MRKRKRVGDITPSYNRPLNHHSTRPRTAPQPPPTPGQDFLLVSGQNRQFMAEKRGKWGESKITYGTVKNFFNYLPVDKN